MSKLTQLIDGTWIDLSTVRKITVFENGNKNMPHQWLVGIYFHTEDYYYVTFLSDGTSPAKERAEAYRDELATLINMMRTLQELSRDHSPD